MKMIEKPSNVKNPPLLEPVWRTGRKRGRSRLRKAVSRNLGYVGVRVAHAVVCRLPWALGRGLAWIVGTAAYLLLKRERDIATQSLTRVYGADRTACEIQALVRAVFRHAASTAVDWVILRRWPRERLLKRFPEAAQAIQKAVADVKAFGSGAVAITAHCGNWELLALFFSHFAPGTLVTLAKRSYFDKYNSFLHQLRTEHGLEVIYSDESARKMIRALQEGKLLAFLCDQDLRTNSGVFVEFFGLPAYTVTFPVDVARKTGSKLVFCILVKEGKSFRVVFRPPFDGPSTGDASADVLTATQLWTRILEEEIRKYPEQWAWIHPRWRTSPDSPRLQSDRRHKKEREP